MKAFSFLTDKGESKIGIELDSGHYDFTLLWQLFKDIKSFPTAPNLDFLQIMVEFEYFSSENINEVIETVMDFRPLDDLKITEAYKFDVPITRPQKIICIGRNYRAHAKEWKEKVPEKPLFFSKLSSSLTPHESNIRIPAGVGRVDNELELAVVIGKKAFRVSEAAAMDFVAGYTIANDVTAREMQREDIKNGRPWTMAKGLNTFCPMGPYLVPADAIADPHNLDLELKVNGETRQKANTSEMIFKVPQLISYISQYITFYPGDIICTGTPEGTLPLQPGDKIEASIENLGILKNSVFGG